MGKRVKIEKKRRKIVKGKVENCKLGEGLFFPHFSKPLELVLGLPEWKFSTGKKHFTPGKDSGKKEVSPSEKKILLRPCSKETLRTC